MNLDKSINKLSERLNNLYPDPDPDNDNRDRKNEGITHWKGKKIIPANEWKTIAITGIKGSVLKEPFLGFAPIGLQYFPDDLVELALGFEGCSVGPFVDAEPGTKEYEDYKQRLDLYPGEAEWYDEQLARAKREKSF